MGVIASRTAGWKRVGKTNEENTPRALFNTEQAKGTKPEYVLAFGSRRGVPTMEIIAIHDARDIVTKKRVAPKGNDAVRWIA